MTMISAMHVEEMCDLQNGVGQADLPLLLAWKLNAHVECAGAMHTVGMQDADGEMILKRLIASFNRTDRTVNLYTSLWQHFGRPEEKDITAIREVMGSSYQLAATSVGKETAGLLRKPRSYNIA